MRLEGRRALFFGGATGIGRATVERFVTEGARVVLADIENQRGEGAARDGSVWFLRADARHQDEVQGAVAKAVAILGGLDTLVYGAGVQRASRVEEFPLDDFDLMMAVNLRGLFLAVRYAVPPLRASGRGAIVSIASVAGIKGGPGMSGYSASKGGVMAFSKALSVELASFGIRVNVVCPGWIDTPFNDPAITFMGGAANQSAMISQTVPMGRQGVPDEIAPAIAFLASDEASYLTGHYLVVDGGMS